MFLFRGGEGEQGAGTLWVQWCHFGMCSTNVISCGLSNGVCASNCLLCHAMCCYVVIAIIHKLLATICFSSLVNIPPHTGIRAHRYRTHQLTKPGFWGLEKWGKWGKWRKMKGNGGEWGGMGK